MPRPIIATAALALLALAAAGCARGPTPPAYGPPGVDAAAIVNMTNTLAFMPQTVTVLPGGTVEWRNVSFLAHTVTADPAKVEGGKGVALPAGAEPFDSGEIGRGQVWRHTFTKPGIYHYVSKTNGWLGMGGTVEVIQYP